MASTSLFISKVIRVFADIADTFAAGKKKPHDNLEGARGFFVNGILTEGLFFLDHVQALAGQLQRRRTEPCPCQKQVEVGPFEQKFRQVVHLRILQKTHRSDAGEGVLSDHRFDVVIKIDNVGFPEA